MKSLYVLRKLLRTLGTHLALEPPAGPHRWFATDEANQYCLLEKRSSNGSLTFRATGISASRRAK